MIHFKELSSHFTEVGITEENVEKLVLGLGVQSAACPDNIYPRVLRECISILKKPITIILQQSLNTGIVPSDWGRGNMMPIFKKGSKTDPLNYCVISLTSVIYKILEKILRSSIMEHLESNGKLSPHQHDF